MSESYCRLYIDTDEARGTVQTAIDRLLPKAFSALVVEAPVFRNKAFDARARSNPRYDPIKSSALTSEVGAIDERSDTIEAFQAGLILLVNETRKLGWFVTASCDFEERVSHETGWNWSTMTTEPPGRA